MVSARVLSVALAAMAVKHQYIEARSQRDDRDGQAHIALGDADISGCEAGDANRDRTIAIDEILVAVRHALSRCPD